MAGQVTGRTTEAECGGCGRKLTVAEPGEDGWYAEPHPDRPRELVYRFTFRCPHCGQTTTREKSE